MGRDFTEPNDDWEPCLYYTGRDGVATVALTGDEDEDGAARLSGLLVREGATAVAYSGSAWVAQVPREPDGGEPTGEPGRTEAVVVQAADRTEALVYVAPITRYPHRAPTLGRWTRLRGREVNGSLLARLTGGLTALLPLLAG